ncbi:MAG TPA: proline racemase family protein [Thermoanaerobaculia bacterium]|nr:proline racemase family protein [Thermoanaerobaculia bacterium]
MSASPTRRLERARARSGAAAIETIETIDSHAAGEPLRIVVSGYPELPGATILDKRNVALERYDHLRRSLMLEPRGHPDMYGCLITDPATPDGDFGVIFLHNEGYSTMCGHGIVAVVTVGIECSLIAPRDHRAIAIDTPAGRVVASARMEGDRVAAVSFRNVPSFVLHHGIEVAVDGVGLVRCDIAFGGAFYACVELARNPALAGLELAPERYAEIIDLGRRLKHTVAGAVPIRHPAGDPELGFLYGTILVAPSPADGVHSRNACVFADGQVDRSPTGTGVSARIAIHHARGEAALGETLEIDSLIGSRFAVRALEETAVGGLPAVVPEVTGSAFVIGHNRWLLDPQDPLGGGFLLR